MVPLVLDKNTPCGALGIATLDKNGPCGAIGIESLPRMGLVVPLVL